MSTLVTSPSIALNIMQPVAAIHRDDEKSPNAVVINERPQTAQWKLQTQAMNIIGRDLGHRTRIERLQLRPAQLNIDNVFARCALRNWQTHDKSIVATQKSGMLSRRALAPLAPKKCAPAYSDGETPPGYSTMWLCVTSPWVVLGASGHWRSLALALALLLGR